MSKKKQESAESTTPKIQPSLASIDAYIQSFPEDIQAKLRAIRALVQTIVPEAKEKFSYGMPTFFYKGNLVHFAAYRGHIGFYPTPSGTESFAAELSVYKSGKGSVQLPLDKPLPLDLLGRIIAYRKAENEQQELLAKQVSKEKTKARATKRRQDKAKTKAFKRQQDKENLT